MLSSASLAARRGKLRARAVSLKPCSVVVWRAGVALPAAVARINFPQLGGSLNARTESAEAEVLAFVLSSDDPAFDIAREDRIVVTDASTGAVSNGHIVGVRREPWGTEADAATEQ